MPRKTLLALVFAAALPAAAQDTAPAGLAQAVRARIGDDRTGACLAVARIDGDRVERAFECADPTQAGRIGPATAFEIGSVTKPMTATLLALHIAEGRASLEDPLARHLPGTRVPEFGGEPIRLRHLVTHTSGLPALPAGLTPADPSDPYAGLEPPALLDALSKTTLDRAPGTRFEYSNFAMMLLSLVVSRLGDADIETQLRARLFQPAGMPGAHVATPPAGVTAAQGHLSTGRPTAPWTFHPQLSGVGGVRATLDDMLRFVQAQLDGSGDARLDAALAATRMPVATPATPRNVGMNWMLQPWRDGGTLVAHEGGTGGFSSLVAFVPGRRRGVVILSDTSVNALGGLGALGMHLLDPSMPAPKPRRVVAPAPALLAALEGHYRFDNGLAVRLWQQDGALWGQAAGQPAFRFGHDDAGDFHPLDFDALMTPQRQPDGRYALRWKQGGGVMSARRVDAEAGSAAARYEVPAGRLADYVGRYPLAPGFELAFTVDGGRLHVQGTGQPAIALDAVEHDVFVADAVGAELRFERGGDGRVTAVTLRQGGQVLRGERVP
jgi:CubicO group peptidase (beta-lactamase class C family)